MKSRVTSILLVVLAVALAGCYVPSDSQMLVGHTGTIGVTDSEFHMDGVIYIVGHPDQELYHGVSVRLYDDGETPMRSYSLGTIAAKEERNISINSTTIPSFVTIESQDFWDEPVSVLYYIRTQDGYYRCRAVSPTEVPDGTATIGPVNNPCPS